jgi:hypothetical protein
VPEEFLLPTNTLLFDPNSLFHLTLYLPFDNMYHPKIQPVIHSDNIHILLPFPKCKTKLQLHLISDQELLKKRLSLFHNCISHLGVYGCNYNTVIQLQIPFKTLFKNQE